MAMILFLVIVPIAVILVLQRVPVLDKIGVVPVAVGVGFAASLLLAFIEIASFGNAMNAATRSIQTSVAEISVALALPLVIFAANIRTAFRDAKGSLLAICLAFVSVVLASILGALLFRGQIADLPSVAGLSVGAYTGSGINMGAIKAATGAGQDLFVTMITYDIVFSAVYLIAVLLIGSRLAGLFLRPYSGPRDVAEGSAMEHLADDSARAYAQLIRKENLAGLALVFAAALVVVGLSVALETAYMHVFPDRGAESGSIITILSITTLSLLGSLIPALHRVRGSFHLGMVFITIFVFASATMLQPQTFTDMDWALGGYFLFVIFGSMGLQAVFSRLAGIDRDTFLMASGAAVMSVPFIPVIAGALKNRALLVPGIAVAVIGYAIGTYLGMMVATAVRALGL